MYIHVIKIYVKFSSRFPISIPREARKVIVSFYKPLRNCYYETYISSHDIKLQ